MKEKTKKRIKVVVGCAAVGTLGYLGYRRYHNYKIVSVDRAARITKLEMNNVQLLQSNEALKKSNDTLMAAASEGLFDEAIATTVRKLNTAQDKMKYIIEQIQKTPNDTDILKARDTYDNKIAVLSSRLNRFYEAQDAFIIDVE